MILPTDLRLDLHCFVGGAGSDFVEINRNIFADHFRDQHRAAPAVASISRRNAALQAFARLQMRREPRKERCPIAECATFSREHVFTRFVS